MRNKPANSKIEFANSLRGIAVLVVLFGHYLLVFDALKGAYVNFPALTFSPFPWATELVSIDPLFHVNAGPLGISIFFLLSGFVIPNAAASLANIPGGRIAFVIGRLLRIWPTYAVGLLVSVAALWVNSYVNNAPFDQPISRILYNMTLFRDWAGEAQIDGVIWTLEVETKFYLVVLLFWTAISKARIYPIFLLAALALAASPAGATYIDSIYPQITIKNFIWPLPYMLYMSIGILYNYHYRKQLTTTRLWLTSISVMIIFVYTATKSDMHYTGPVSYAVSLALFSFLYFLAKDWTGGPVIRFFAKISFPLYASHAALGYTGMAIMMQNGFPPLLALLAQLSISILIATAIHYAIEQPTHELGKNLGKLYLSNRRAPESRPA